MKENSRHPSSFRDPAGTIFAVDNRIIRSLTTEGLERYLGVEQTGLLQKLVKKNKLVHSKPIDHQSSNSEFVYHLEHEPIDFISYPYEWPFKLLKEAALLHLSLQLEALDHQVVFIDASAYNVQFKGVTPIFIDILSLRLYQEGEFWTAHRQFCEQFLNPLLLNAEVGIPYQEWYRGFLEGIPTDQLAKLMPLRSWLSPRLLFHVLLPARGQKLNDKQKQSVKNRSQHLGIPKSVYSGFLKQLYKWIASLEPRRRKSTTWGKYIETRTYTHDEILLKKNFVAEFISKTTPNQLWDIGCNNGEFAELALQNGAQLVIGFDSDLGALDSAVERAKQKNLSFLPLYQQITNPTPDQGWLSTERKSIFGRGSPDALLALAIIHHLALGANIPLPEVVKWLTDTAPAGVIEFVQKTDPTVQQMLALKGDIFPNYSEEIFKNLLSNNANIIKIQTVSASGRQLYWYEK